ncbi:MAG: hypothetical protein SGCHY_001527 [Lobulomycetales sp.]
MANVTHFALVAHQRLQTSQSTASTCTTSATDFVLAANDPDAKLAGHIVLVLKRPMTCKISLMLEGSSVNLAAPGSQSQSIIKRQLSFSVSNAATSHIPFSFDPLPPLPESICINSIGKVEYVLSARLTWHTAFVVRRQSLVKPVVCRLAEAARISMLVNPKPVFCRSKAKVDGPSRVTLSVESSFLAIGSDLSVTIHVEEIPQGRTLRYVDCSLVTDRSTLRFTPKRTSNASLRNGDAKRISGSGKGQQIQKHPFKRPLDEIRFNPSTNVNSPNSGLLGRQRRCSITSSWEKTFTLHADASLATVSLESPLFSIRSHVAVDVLLDDGGPAQRLSLPICIVRNGLDHATEYGSLNRSPPAHQQPCGSPIDKIWTAHQQPCGSPIDKIWIPPTPSEHNDMFSIPFPGVEQDAYLFSCPRSIATVESLDRDTASLTVPAPPPPATDLYTETSYEPTELASPILIRLDKLTLNTDVEPVAQSTLTPPTSPQRYEFPDPPPRSSASTSIAISDCPQTPEPACTQRRLSAQEKLDELMARISAAAACPGPRSMDIPRAAVGETMYRALFGYTPLHRDEMCVQAGDVIAVPEGGMYTDGWARAVNSRSGCTGMVPIQGMCVLVDSSVDL